MIDEPDRVALARDLPGAGLEEGTVGTVVHVHRDGAAYEVEFVTFGGDSFGVSTVERDAVRDLGNQDS